MTTEMQTQATSATQKQKSQVQPMVHTTVTNPEVKHSSSIGQHWRHTVILSMALGRGLQSAWPQTRQKYVHRSLNSNVLCCARGPKTCITARFGSGRLNRTRGAPTDTAHSIVARPTPLRPAGCRGRCNIPTCPSSVFACRS